MESARNAANQHSAPLPAVVPALPPPGLEHLATQHSIAPILPQEGGAERAPKRRRVSDDDPELEDTATSTAGAGDAGEVAEVVAQVAANAGADEAAAAGVAEVEAPVAAEGAVEADGNGADSPPMLFKLTRSEAQELAALLDEDIATAKAEAEEEARAATNVFPLGDPIFSDSEGDPSDSSEDGWSSPASDADGATSDEDSDMWKPATPKD